ncbi:outer membrane protein assembly factor BamB family protein [Streptomyces nodosus]
MNQPPGQPPQDGFGAPQNPPSGGFGAPQEPQPPQPPSPPQPGYGYPQQPGPYATPQQPGPYAQPGPYTPPQQPGPYAQQGPYAQPGPYTPSGPYTPPGPYAQPQPGYGYPPQPPQFPGARTPPPGGGSKNPFKGRAALAVGAAVVALLVIGGTVFALSGDGGDKKPVADRSGSASPSASAPKPAPVDPGDGSGDGGEDTDLNEGRKPGEAKVLWYKEAPDAPGSGADATGMWITGTTAVKAAYKQIFGYRVSDGRPAWAPVSFPQKICAVTRQKSSDDKIVVAYKDGVSDTATCNQLQQIDLRTGKKGWGKEVPEGALFDSTLTLGLTLVGDTLVVGRSQSGTAFDLGTGKKLWDKLRYDETCYPSGFAGGTRLISISSCAAATDNQHDEVQELDPATGKARWTRKMPQDWRVENVYSVDPVVLYSTDEDGKHGNIATLRNDGSVRSEVQAKDSFAPDCEWAFLDRDLQDCPGAVADADTLYLPTEAKRGPNDIVAISLDTGKERWRVKSPGDTSMLPLKTEGGRLIVYAEASYNAGGRIVAVPTTGGSHTMTTLLQNPTGAARIESDFFSKAIDYVDGRFYISTTQLSGDGKSKEKLMLAYGK